MSKMPAFQPQKKILGASAPHSLQNAKICLRTSAGGTKTYVEALAPFGLDPRQKVFWAAGMKQIERLVEEFRVIAVFEMMRDKLGKNHGSKRRRKTETGVTEKASRHSGDDKAE